MAGKWDVAARVLFLHPIHDVAVLKFDTASFDKELLKACQLAPPGPALKPGDEVFYVTFDLAHSIMTRTRIVNIHTDDHDYSDKGSFDFVPFHHQTCLLEALPQGGDSDGILVNAEGQVLGLRVVDFYSDHYYLPIDDLRTIASLSYFTSFLLISVRVCFVPYIRTGCLQNLLLFG